MLEVNGVLDTALPPAPASTSRNQLSQEDFFQIMISELSNQDPLEPLDNQQFLNQLTQMQTLETMTRLSDGLEGMLIGQQLSSAGALIGKNVKGEAANGVSIEGTVDRVLVNGSSILLGVGESLLPLSGVREVLAAGDSE